MLTSGRICVLTAALALVAVLATACQTPVEQRQTVEDQRYAMPQLARDGFPGTVPYQVQPGDTLFAIAQRHGTTVAALAALNGLADPSAIEAGWYLLVPAFTPTPPPGGASVRFDHGSHASSLVALTFDMGGRVEPALDIMQWLIDHEVPATIFLTGATIESQVTSAGREVLALVATHPELFELGNHSYSHPDFTTLTAAQMRDELERTEAAIAANGGSNPRPRFRPPFGAVDGDVLDAVGEAGYVQTIMWDVDTIDWLPEADGGPTAAAIVAKVTANARGGSIVLMHLGGYNTLEALPGILSGLTARGLELARVSTVLAAP